MPCREADAMLHDPPGDQPSTCVGGPEVGHGNHYASAPAASANGNHGSRHLDQKCQHCDQPGVRFYDREWCCAACGQDVLHRLTEELVRPVPKPAEPGQRGRRKGK